MSNAKITLGKFDLVICTQQMQTEAEQEWKTHTLTNTHIYSPESNTTASSCWPNRTLENKVNVLFFEIDLVGYYCFC